MFRGPLQENGAREKVNFLQKNTKKKVADTVIKFIE